MADKMNSNRGFTLIELMVLITVIGVLTVVAIPNFSATIKGNRDTAQINALQNALAYARSEALKNGSAMVCAGSSATCDNSDWSDGWVVVATLPSGATTVVRAFSATDGSSVTSSGGSQFAFNQAGMVFSDGSFSTPSASTFALCDSRGADFGRSLDLLPTGRAMVGSRVGYTINGNTPLVCAPSSSVSSSGGGAFGLPGLVLLGALLILTGIRKHPDTPAHAQQGENA